jgi:hypothetical protein
VGWRPKKRALVAELRAILRQAAAGGGWKRRSGAKVNGADVNRRIERLNAAQNRLAPAQARGRSCSVTLMAAAAMGSWAGCNNKPLCRAALRLAHSARCRSTLYASAEACRDKKSVILRREDDSCKSVERPRLSRAVRILRQAAAESFR